jgi:putative methyltransferase
MSKNTSPYHAAGTLLNSYLKERNRGLKSIAFDSGANNVPSSSNYATVAKTIQHLPAINSVLNANNKKLSKAINFESFKNQGLAYVMIYELLFSKFQKIRGGGKIKRMIVKHESELRQEVEEYTSKNPIEGLAVDFPRYVRVNVMHSTVTEAANILQEQLAKVNKDGAQEVYADAHVPDLLVLPPNASSWLHHDFELVKSGKIVLQDKSSCFSALVCTSTSSGLGGGDYIDACSAPGNKTSHLAALLHASSNAHREDERPKKKKKGKSTEQNPIRVFACERSSARFDVLKTRMDSLVSSPSVAVEPMHVDFLKIDPSDPKFANVRAIMLDPSCSGSGIVNAPDRSTTQNSDEKRRQTLANFQTVALKHAMSFPQVERIVYSTCSVHDEENEMVVSKALAEMNSSAKKEDGNEWMLVAPQCLTQWPRRGKESVGGLSKAQADCLIRCDGLDGDETNGFFVSYFERARVSAGSKATQNTEVTCNAATGIPLYSGQYKNVGTKPQTKLEEGKGAKSKNDVTPNKAAEKSAKKREKKLAWRRKQALQKEERLKKRKAATTEG